METKSFAINELIKPVNGWLDDSQDIKTHPLYKTIQSEMKGNLSGILLSNKFFKQMFTQIEELLHIDIRKILAAAWLNSPEISTLIQNFQSEEDTFSLPLRNHQIVSEHRPSLTPFINGVQVGKIDFTINLQCLIEDTFLKINSGKIMEAVLGKCTAGIRLLHDQQLLLEKQQLTIAEDLNFNVSSFINDEKKRQYIPDDHQFLPGISAGKTN